MQQINSTDIISKTEHLSILRIQNGILPFTEKPSDRHEIPEPDFAEEKINSRINPVTLFSLFTADIIRENVVYTR